MMKECWINVYSYPKSGYWNSHQIVSREHAKLYDRNIKTRKTVYRLHVKLKPGWEFNHNEGWYYRNN